MQKTIVPCAAFDRAAAQKVLRQVLQKPDSTLCLATGDTTAGIFTRMVELKQALDLDCARVKCINMDEYVGVRREEPASCYFRIVRDLYAPLGLREDQFYVPVAPTSQAQQERERFARKLRGFGGIDFMLLSVGGNGHIAFNEPGADFGAHIHVANLTQSTLQAKAELFGGADKVPAQGLTLGIADVMAARHILLVANGVHKAEIIRRAMARLGLAPERARIALCAPSQSAALEAAARELSKDVRYLALCAPNGERLARTLRWDCGASVHTLQTDERIAADLSVCFDDFPLPDGLVLPLGSGAVSVAYGTENLGDAAMIWNEDQLICALYASLARRADEIWVKDVKMPPDGGENANLP